jgi:hypothetical protein
MKIGEYITIQEIANQSEYRWIVLSDFEYCDYGGYEDIEGGIIRCIADTQREASKVSVKLHLDGTNTLLMSGAIEPLSVGGVFVK